MKTPSDHITGRRYDLVTFVSALLFISLVLTFIIFAVQGIQRKNFDKYLLNASEQQVLAHQIAKYAVEAGSGNESAFARLGESRDRASFLLKEMKEGSPEKNLPPSPDFIQPKLTKVNEAWRLLETQVDSILNKQLVIIQARGTVDHMRNLLPGLQEVVTSAANRLVEAGMRNQVYHATRLLFVTQRINTDLYKVLDGGLPTVVVLDQLAQDIDELNVIAGALSDGDKSLGVNPVKDEIALNYLTEIVRHLAELVSQREELLGLMGELLPTLTALGTTDESGREGLDESEASIILEVASGNLAKLDSELIALYISSAGKIKFGQITLSQVAMNLFGVASLVLIILLGYLSVRRAKKRERMASEQIQVNQVAIRNLLNDIGDLADGDLTIEATVTQDITGAIADSINATVESMRDVIASINTTSKEVSDSARENLATIEHLTQSTELQRNGILGASEVCQNMTDTLTQMAEKAKLLAEIAAHSLELAEKGGLAVNRNTGGMETLREQIQGTSKRIKRLGESSQEIGSIVGLINDITDQTNVLAMNASMQAAMAGDAGRGFAIVADEVQRLAERSANATKKIETLVNAIQVDTGEAVVSMESSISEVLSCARLAEEAGRALEEIETVSQQITENTTEMSISAQGQSTNTSNLNDTMQEIQEITKQISKGTKSTSSGIANLSGHVNELRNSVDAFILPEEDGPFPT